MYQRVDFWKCLIEFWIWM